MIASPLADDDLVLLARAGSQEAFCALVERYRAAVVRFAYRLTRDADEANDVAQEALFRAYRNLRSFDPDRSFAPWLFAITRNASHDALRRTRRNAAVEVVQPGCELGPEELALRNDDEVRVRAALAALPGRYREVLELYYLQGLLYREVSEALGIPLGTVKTYMRRAKERLRTELTTRELGLAA